MKRNRFISYCISAGLIVFILSFTNATIPKIFLMGDSISIHYGPYLIKDLQGVADIDQKKIETLNGKEWSRNGGDSKRVLSYLRSKLEQPGFHPDYIILNCGLHDIGRDSIKHTIQIAPELYRRNLDSIFTLISQKNIRIIWITTTPVVDSIHNSRTKQLVRFASDLENYNRIAAEVTSQYKIPTVDLHDFTLTLGNDAYLDNVHYKEEIRPLQAAYIAGAVRTILKQQQTRN